MLMSEPVERVVLLGFMCSGKSVVGSALARRLEWDFIDFDVEIERREGMSISDLIAQRGEAYFRRLEAELTALAATRGQLVMSPGGGWITDASLLESIREGTLSVWLKVSPPETVRRLREDPIERPLKRDPDALETVGVLIDEREPLYRLADLTVPADGRSVESVAFELEQIIRGRSHG